MTGPGLSCEVYVDGNRLADTAADYHASVPTALTGLSVNWGRSTVVDQPDASGCSFTVADIGGDADFLGLLHVGHIVDVYAAGAISSGTAPVDVTVDGSFETSSAAQRVYVTGGTAATDTTQPATGNRAIRITPANAATVAVPPGPFSGSPTAWNTIPKVNPGEHWTITLQLVLGPGCTGTIAPALYATPAAGPPVQVGPAQAVTPSPTAQYQPVSVAWTIPAGATGWVGLQLAITGTQRWLDATGTWAAQTLTWRQLGTAVLDDLHVWAPPQATRRVEVFAGRITDLAATPVTDGVQVAVTCQDRYADLANDYIGDQPWLVETIANRVKRITTLAATSFSVDVAAWPGGRQVTWIDIDSQPVAGLLADLATSADAVLWPVFAANRGFYLWMEDTAQRQALAVLVVNPGTGLVVIADIGRPSGAVLVSACDVGADNVTWQQDVSDVLSIVDLTWQEQTVDDEGKPDPTERHITLVDQDAQAQFGLRRLGYSTQLVSPDDGNTVASRLMARSRALGWRVSGITWDTNLPPDGFDDTHRASALTVLDGTKRVGLPVVLDELPAWTPSGDTVSTYLEGGTYTYTDGRWTLDLTLSPAGLTGQSIQWAQVDPSYRWRDFDPSIAWFDLYGVGKAA